MEFKFLVINGWRARVLDDGASKSFEKIGDRGRAFTGRMRSTRRALKRRFRGTLIRSTRSFAEAFQAAVLGLGERWPFDFEDTARLKEDFFSTKGLGAKPSSDALLAFGVAADGAAVFNREGETESQFGSGSLASTLAIANILPDDVRDVEGGTTAGFTAIGTGAISLDTANKLQGTQSLKAVSMSALDGFDTDFVLASPLTTYTLVVYIKPVTDPTVDIISISLFDDDIGFLAGGNISTFDSTGKWVKVEITGTTGDSATQIKLRVQIATAGRTFFCDAFQIAAGDIDTAIWVDGSSVVSDLIYPIGFLDGAADVTANFWVRADAVSPAGQSIILLMSPSFLDTRGFCIDRAPGANQIRFFTTDPDTGVTTGISVFSVFDGAWHMVTAVTRSKPVAGESKMDLYVDGLSVATASPVGLPVIDSSFDIRVGHKNANDLWWPEHRGLLDDVSIYPYAAHPDQIAGWFALGEALGDLPEFKASGDFVGDTQVIVEGHVGESPYVAFTDRDGVHHNAGQEVNFTLDEV